MIHSPRKESTKQQIQIYGIQCLYILQFFLKIKKKDYATIIKDPPKSDHAICSVIKKAD
jgi:hypothetical protein